MAMRRGRRHVVRTQTHGCEGELPGEATHWIWGGCPDEAPVEFYQVFGADHGEADTLGGHDIRGVALEFFEGVERALSAKHS